MWIIYLDRRSGLYLPDTARPRAKGYSEAGASITRRALKSFRADSGSPNEDINYNNATLRQRGRHPARQHRAERPRDNPMQSLHE